MNSCELEDHASMTASSQFQVLYIILASIPYINVLTNTRARMHMSRERFDRETKTHHMRARTDVFADRVELEYY